jgi:hypothetical protein
MRDDDAMDPLEGVKYVEGNAADVRGPLGVYTWQTERGAHITVSIPRDRRLTQKIRDSAEEHAHRTLEESGDERAGFSFNLRFSESEPSISRPGEG